MKNTRARHKPLPICFLKKPKIGYPVRSPPGCVLRDQFCLDAGMVTSVSITCRVLASVPALWLLGCVLAVLIQCLLTLTLVPPQCKEGGFPQELWLGVSADAVSVYKRGEGKPLEVFQYEHILSFGAPLANTYKIVVDERELLFETSEVRGRGGQTGFTRSQGKRTVPPSPGCR